MGMERFNAKNDLLRFRFDEYLLALQKNELLEELNSLQAG